MIQEALGRKELRKHSPGKQSPAPGAATVRPLVSPTVRDCDRGGWFLVGRLGRRCQEIAGKYSEIVWLPKSRIAPAWANARPLTGLPKTYIADRGCGREWPRQWGRRRVARLESLMEQPPAAFRAGLTGVNRTAVSWENVS